MMICRRLMAGTWLALAGLAMLALSAPRAALASNGRAAGQQPQDWTWVHGAVFVPTNCVNEAQMWDEYDPAIIDRELHYASIYGLNCVRVFLHFDIYRKKKSVFLGEIDDFLKRADKYALKTNFVLFDDCWHEPPADVLNMGYRYPAPIFGIHNSQWLLCPGNTVLHDYDRYKDQLQAYVHDVVKAHVSDRRVAFWETYNEPGKSPEVQRLMIDALQWIRDTGTKIPVTATGGGFAGDPYSDFKSWHQYGSFDILGDPKQALCTESMHRTGQSVPAEVAAWKGKTGFEMWEFGIGRDNCRFGWDDNPDHPAAHETATPFHGIVFADGHPWSIGDVRALLGDDGFAKAPLFTVEYFRDENWTDLGKTSVTPMIDFDRLDEEGYGSPDMTAGIPREHYSVRWTGMVRPPRNAIYTLFADTDGRVKVLVDGASVIDKSFVGHVISCGAVSLTAGTDHKVTVEYAHATGNSSLHVTWSGPKLKKQVLMPLPGQTDVRD